MKSKRIGLSGNDFCIKVNQRQMTNAEEQSLLRITETDVNYCGLWCTARR